MNTHDHSTKNSVDTATKQPSQEVPAQEDLSRLGTFYSLQDTVRDPRSEAFTPSTVLQLQRTIGNQAVQRLLRQTSNKIIIQRGQGSSRPKAPILRETDDPIILPFNTKKPKWEAQGAFSWEVGFATNMMDGYIVQKVVNEYEAEDEGGVNKNGYNVRRWKPEPVYWERWRVQDRRVIPESNSTNDFWIREARGPNSSGRWSMTGTLYYLPEMEYWDKDTVSDAAGLESSYAAPEDLGEILHIRRASGVWTPKKHKGEVEE